MRAISADFPHPNPLPRASREVCAITLDRQPIVRLLTLGNSTSVSLPRHAVFGQDPRN